MIQINSFDDLAVLIESDKLTNKQVFEVVQNTMNLFLSDEEIQLSRSELATRLKTHYNKYLKQGGNIVPLFLNLDLSIN